jgi:cytoplasmic iron level regulating protein YaaA (DUF328/UPF0246 family)
LPCMKLIISPAKTLDFETPAKTKQSSSPKYLKQADELVLRLQKLSESDIAKLMDLSPKLAKLNYERFEGWASAPQKQAVLAYMGDVYEGLDASSFTEKDFNFAQENLRILSGLYGLLKPLDLIKPYRLEMSTKIGLYEFWGNSLTKELADELVINLASSEYSSAVKPKNMVTINFYETKNGKPKIIGIFAKKARGMMARYIIKNQITKPEEIKKFKESGYKFNKDMSDDKCYSFTR